MMMLGKHLLWDPVIRHIACCMFLIGSIIASFSPYISILATNTFAFSGPQFSLMLAVGSITDLAGSIFVGIKTDQTGQRRSVAIFLCTLIILGAALVWMIPSKLTFFITHAIIWSISFSLIGQLFALARLSTSELPLSERDGTMAALRAVFAVPFGLLPPVLAVVFNWGVSISAVYPIIGIIASICLLVIAAYWPHDNSRAAYRVRSGLTLLASLKEMWLRDVVIRIVLLSAISMGPTLYLSFLGLLFLGSEGREISDVGYFVGLVAILEILFMTVIPQLLTRLSNWRLIAISSYIYAGFLACLSIFVSSDFVWALTIPASLGAAIILSLPIAYLQRLMHERPGAAGALMTTVHVGGALLSAIILALGTGFLGLFWVGILAAVIVLAGGIGLAFVDGAGTEETGNA